jgi:putative membrane protein
MPARRIAVTAAFAAVALSSPASASASVDDHMFAVNATRANLAEVAAGRLALDKSDDAAVRAYARKMIRDHTAAQKKLAAIAKATDTTLPKQPTKLQRAEAARLGRLSGNAFDSAYLRRQVSDHRKALATMLLELDTGTVAALRNYASATAPVVRMHLAMAKQTGAGR